MSNPSPGPYAVIGATGQQGGSVVDALLDQGAAVRALVRDPHSERARALSSRGVELVTADQEDRGALEDALAGVSALSFYTTFDDADGTEGEIRRGSAIADAAHRAGVPRVVYSSVGGAERETRIPHFESKRRVEQRLSELVAATFVRPTFFMENLSAQLPSAPADEIVLRFPMAGDIALQLVSVRDIGRAVARLLLDPAELQAPAIELAGDELTPDQIADRVARVSGLPARFEELPASVLADDPDLSAMFAWFSSGAAYAADLAACRRLVPGLQSVDDWLAARTGDPSGRRASGSSV